MKKNPTSLTSWLFMVAMLLLGIAQPVFANTSPQTDGPVIEGQPERPLYGPEAALAQQPMPVTRADTESGGGNIQWNNVPWSEMVYQNLDPITNSDWDLWMTESSSGLTYQLMNTPYHEVQPRLNWSTGQVVYVQVNGSSYDIYKFNLQTHSNIRLTFTGTEELNPDWSPDGTKIVYESYQDGQAEIYVMNADGSAPTRLTYSAGGSDYDFDGMPSWSPDGTKIAFVSKRTGGYRIWVMNADGTNATILTTRPYSAHPVWKPDGSALMFSCDVNGDSFYDTWHINMVTFQDYSIISNSQTDYWPNSYSPNGEYQLLTKVNYVYYNDAWYWTSAQLIDPHYGSMLPGDLVWGADWASYDLTPPTASLAALPEISPAPPAIVPYLYDGQSGIYRYIIQVQEEGGQTWETIDPNWYLFQGGQSYYFRIQAYDYGGNVDPNPNYDAFTTIEWYPPVSQITSLPEYSKSSTIDLSLTSHDVGGSVIRSHEIQTYDHAVGEWTTLVNTSNQTVEFEGEIGHTYSFRSAAVDQANNTEEWPASPFGDATTTLYERAITGQVYTNTGLPVSSAEVITTPSTMNDPTSLSTGFYAGYFGAGSDPFTTFWTKDGYGTLSTTTFTGNADMAVNAYLPPADNVMLNWDFEEGADTLVNWTTGGIFTPSLNTDQYHTGTASATVGLTASFSPTMPAGCRVLDSVMTPDGVLHAICEGMYHISYNSGIWSAPTQITTWNPSYNTLELLAASDNSLHIFCKYMSGYTQSAYHISRDPSGVWSLPINLFETNAIVAYSYTLDDSGGLHIAHGYSSSNLIHYSHRWPNGTWDSEISYPIPGNATPDHLAITTDASNQPTILYWKFWSGSLEFMNIIHKQDDGSWQTLLSDFITEKPLSAVSTIISPKGEMISVWISMDNVWIIRRDPAGTWSAPIEAGPRTGLYITRLQTFLGIDHKLYLFTKYTEHSQVHTRGSYIDLETNQMPDSQFQSHNYDAAVDHQGRIHMAYNHSTSYDLYYRYQDNSGDWHDELLKPYEGNIYPVISSISIDASDQPHFLYQGNDTETVVHQYRQLYAPQSGSSILKQTVLIPEGHPVLSFVYENNHFNSPDAQLKVSILQGGETTEVFATTPSTTLQWEHAAIDLSPWAGHTATISFTTSQKLGEPRTAYFIDEVSIGTGQPDLWVRGLAIDALPGEQVTVQLTYGNRSVVEAEGGLLTLTLPAGLALLEANPPADLPGGDTWTIAALPAHSNGVVTLQLEVSADATLFDSLIGDISIATSGELETANNQAQLLVRVGNYLFLPLVER